MSWYIDRVINKKKKKINIGMVSNKLGAHGSLDVGINLNILCAPGPHDHMLSVPNTSNI